MIPFVYYMPSCDFFSRPVSHVSQQLIFRALMSNSILRPSIVDSAVERHRNIFHQTIAHVNAIGLIQIELLKVDIKTTVSGFFEPFGVKNCLVYLN